MSGVPPADSVSEALSQWIEAMPGMEPAPLGIGLRIQLLAKHLEVQTTDALSDLDLLPWQYEVLAALRRSSGLRATPSELIAATLRTSGAMTHRLDQLESDGLVTRKPHPDDRRSVSVVLTKRGKLLAEKAVNLRVRRLATIFGVFNQRESDQISRLLAKLLTRCEEIGADNK